MSAIVPAGAATGQTIYFQLQSAANAKIWNGTFFASFNPANWALYWNQMDEHAGSGRYFGTVPSDALYGRFIAWVFLQLGPAPAVGDTILDFVFVDVDRDGNASGPATPKDLGWINGLKPPAQNLAVSAAQFVIGNAVAGTLTNAQMTTSLFGTVPNIYAGRVLYFTSGANAGLAVLITAYDPTGAKVTFIGFNNQPAPAAPAESDTFIII